MTDNFEVTLDAAKWFATVYRGKIAFRFGPFDGPAIGKIMAQCAEERIDCLVTGVVEGEFDWEVARNMRGFPAGDPEHEGNFAPMQPGDLGLTP